MNQIILLAKYKTTSSIPGVGVGGGGQHKVRN